MFDLLPSDIEHYCEEHTSPENDLLYRLNRETHLRVLQPRMISGKLQGAFLSFLSRLIKPKQVLEIGTYTGYSAICLAEGLQEDGMVDTIEIDEEQEEIIRRYISQSPYKDQIHLHIGMAKDVIPRLNKCWDMVLIDADKREYLTYYELIIPHLRKGGVVLVDNVLWSGKVLKEVKRNDKDTMAVMEFNDHVQRDTRVRNVMLPFRDGILMIEKL